MILTGFPLMLQNAEIPSSIPIPGDDWEVVTVLPRNQRERELFTKHLNCSDGLKPIYALHSVKKKTILGCAKNVIVNVREFCIEYNTRGVQEKYDARRTSNIPGLPSYINASEGYLLWDCFETYGGVPSPQEREKDINHLKSENAEQKQTIRALQQNVTDMMRESAEQEQTIRALQEVTEKNKLIVFQILFALSVILIFGFLIAFFVFKKLGFIQFDIRCKTKSTDTQDHTDRCNDQSNSQDQLLDNVVQRNEDSNLHSLTCTLSGTLNVPDALSRNGGTTPF